MIRGKRIWKDDPEQFGHFHNFFQEHFFVTHPFLFWLKPLPKEVGPSLICRPINNLLFCRPINRSRHRCQVIMVALGVKRMQDGTRRHSMQYFLDLALVLLK
jgi:hypothetical protein